MTGAVGFLLLAYNSEATIAEALRSALALRGEPLDIIVSDDCSTDRTFEIVQAVAASYRGHHRLRCYRNPRNLGLLGNLTTAAARCENDLLIIGAGDDRSHPERAQSLADAWRKAGAPSAAYLYSGVRPIDSTGAAVRDWPERVARPPWSLLKLAGGRNGGPLGATSALTRRLLAEPGSVPPSVCHEDRVFPFRALLLGGEVLFVDEPLVDYRVEGGISRIVPASRFEELTVNTKRRVTNMLPDARQRLTDAIAANAPSAVIRRCRQVIAEHETLLEMGDDRNLVSKAVKGIAKGARKSEILKQLARFALARAEQLADRRS